MTTVVLSKPTSTDVDDEVLEALILPATEEELRSARRGDEEPQNPFTLEVTPPYALDIVELYRHAGREVPPELASGAGPSVPVLLVHNVTPFPAPGARAPGIWGLGYTCRMDGVEAATVSLMPSTKERDLASAGANVKVGISAGGELGIPDAALQLAGAVPGLSVADTKISATADAHFGLGLEWRLSALDVRSGPVGAGGARWDLYKRGDRLDSNHRLMHTVLLPTGTTRVMVSIEIWLRTRRLLPGPKRHRQWNYPAQPFTVSLERLGV
ncbi:MAG: hypothetical protein ACJ780_24930 [Solirubrobacteraceae bacterium]